MENLTDFEYNTDAVGEDFSENETYYEPPKHFFRRVWDKLKPLFVDNRDNEELDEDDYMEEISEHKEEIPVGTINNANIGSTHRSAERPSMSYSSNASGSYSSNYGSNSTSRSHSSDTFSFRKSKITEISDRGTRENGMPKFIFFEPVDLKTSQDVVKDCIKNDHLLHINCSKINCELGTRLFDYIKGAIDMKPYQKECLSESEGIYLLAPMGVAIEEIKSKIQQRTFVQEQEYAAM